jgi:hypothetical protein
MTTPSILQHRRPPNLDAPRRPRPCAIATMDRTELTGDILLRLHQSGDWGNVPPEDAEENELAIRRELRILSSYGGGEDGDRLQLGPTPSTSI